MVALSTIHASNTNLPTSLTAVFVGGTSGIGLYTLLALSRHCAKPTIYFIGRSAPAAERILSDLRHLNPNGTYTFLRADVSRLAQVDTVCAQIREGEAHVNILCLSQGTLAVGQETDEGLHVTAALALHSRTRFALNLLPLLRAASGIRRVVSVFAGTKEGSFDATGDLQLRGVKSPLKARGHAASGVTLLLEEVRRRAPEVGCVHMYPGFVKTGIGRDMGLVGRMMTGVMQWALERWLYVSADECGERSLWLCTDGRFSGVGGEVGEAAVGTDGRVGSGVYTVDDKGESGNEAVVEVLRGLRAERKDVWVWEEVRRDFLRITGKESL